MRARRARSLVPLAVLALVVIVLLRLDRDGADRARVAPEAPGRAAEASDPPPIHVLVLDQNDLPVSGIVVVAKRASPDPLAEPGGVVHQTPRYEEHARVETDDAGVARVDGIALADSFLVSTVATARHAACTSGAFIHEGWRLGLGHDVGGVPHVVIRLVAAAASRRVRIIDTDGARVAARVRLSHRLLWQGPWHPVDAERDALVPWPALDPVSLSISLSEELLWGLPVPAPSDDGTIEVRLPDGVVRGTVRDERGAPLPGVHVRVGSGVVPDPLAGKAAGTSRAITDAQGAFVTRAFEGGVVHEVLVEATGQSSRAFRELRWPVDRNAPASLDLVLPQGGRVRGRVVDPAGAPLAGALVALARWHSLLRWTDATFMRPRTAARTDADGRFELWGVPDGDIALHASHEGHGVPSLTHVRMPKESAREVVIEMRPLRVVRGIVRADDGHAVPHAIVTAVRTGWEGRAVNRRGVAGTVADGAGRFALPLPIDRPADAVLARRGALASDPIPLPTDDDPLEISVRRLARVSGRIVAASPEQVLFVVVMLQPRGVSGPWDIAFSAPDGRFAISGVPPGFWTLVTLGERRRIEVGERDVTGLRLDAPDRESMHSLPTRVEAGPVLDVAVVTADGTPVPHASAHLTPPVGEDGSIGDSIVVAVLGGRLLARLPHADGHAWRLAIRDAVGVRGEALGAGALESAVLDLASPPERIVLPRGREVEGVVVDEAGAGIARATVRLLAGTRVVARQKTEQWGGFRFVDAPSGAVGLEIDPPNAFLDVSPRTIDPTTSNVRIVVSRGDAIEGRVVDPDGEPVPGAKVTLVTRGGRPRRIASAKSRTDQKGGFRIEGVAADVTGDLRVEPAQGLTPDLLPDISFDVAAGAGGVEVILRRGARVPFAFELLEGWAHARVALEVASGHEAPERYSSWRELVQAPATEGNFHTPALEPGRAYWIRVRDLDGGDRSRPVRVVVPSEEVTLRLPKRLPVRGRVEATDPTGFEVLWFRPSGPMFDGEVDAEGRLTTPLVLDEPGTLLVSRPSDGLVARLGPVRPSDGPFTINPKPGFTLRVRVKDDHPGETRVDLHARGRWIRDGEPDGSGLVVFRALPNERFDLYARSHATGEMRVARAEHVLPGGREIVLDLDAER